MTIYWGEDHENQDRSLWSRGTGKDPSRDTHSAPIKAKKTEITWFFMLGLFPSTLSPWFPRFYYTLEWDDVILCSNPGLTCHAKQLTSLVITVSSMSWAHLQGPRNVLWFLIFWRILFLFLMMCMWGGGGMWIWMQTPIETTDDPTGAGVTDGFELPSVDVEN